MIKLFRTLKGFIMKRIQLLFAYLIMVIPVSSINAYNRLVFHADDYYHIFLHHTQFVLDIKGGNDADNTPVIIWHIHGGENQQWKIIPCSERGYYYIISRKNGKYLDIANENSENAVIVIKRNSQSDSQKWKIISSDNGNTQIVSKVNGYYIDIKGTENIQGLELILSRPSRLKSQKWSLVSLQAIGTFNEAEKLLKQGNHSQALLLYQKAVQLHIYFGEAYQGLGIVFEKLKKYHEALASLNKAAILLPDDPWIYCHLARNYYSTKNIHKVLENYDKAIAVFKRLNRKIPAWILLNASMYCYTELKPKDPLRAIRYAKEVIAGDYETNQKKGAYESMAFSFFEMNDLINALKYAKLRGNDFWMTRQLSPRKIVFHISIRFQELMRTTFRYLKPGLLKIHMPMDTPYQNFISLESMPRSLKIIKEGRENLALFDFSRGFPEKLNLKITLKNIVVNTSPERIYQVTSGNDEIRKFADRTYFKSFAGMQYDIDNPVLVNKVKEITRNDNTPKEKILSIIQWIKANIVHDSNIPQYANNPVNFRRISEVLMARHGYCTQISALFIGMCRMLNIPARMIQGLHLTPDPHVTRGKVGAHDCVEIYDSENKQWIYVEPQGYSRLGINYWGHIVFYSERLAPRENFIDIMMIGAKSHMTYEFFQDL